MPPTFLSLASTSFPSTTPLPRIYYAAFAFLEPAGMMAGAIFAIFFPSTFARSYFVPLLGSTGASPGAISGHTTAGQAARLCAGGFGTCMFIIGLLGGFVLPKLRYALEGKHDAEYEQVLEAYCAALSVGDISHIAVTLALLPHEIRVDPWNKWTFLVWGNIAGTAAPALIRLLWYCRVGRHSPRHTPKGRTERTPLKGSAGAERAQ